MHPLERREQLMRKMGITIMPRLKTDNRQVWRVTCNCMTHDEVRGPISMPPEQVERKFALRGWALKTGKTPTCHACRATKARGTLVNDPVLNTIKKVYDDRQQLDNALDAAAQALGIDTGEKIMAVPKEEMTPAIGPDLKIARRVYGLLDDHFDDQKRVYRPSWSDAAVADAAKTSEELVARIRREAYGELAEDPFVTNAKRDMRKISNDVQTFTNLMQNEVAAKSKELTIQIEQIAKDLYAKIETVMQELTKRSSVK